MTRAQLALRYASFAVLAVIANLGVQRAVLFGTEADQVSASHMVLAMAAGTAVGLAVKYVLDKHWIFYDQTTGLRAQGTQFLLYSLMGVVTTLIFWVTEMTFWAVWKTDLAREAGAVLGLSVGYLTKYLLDRRFVFNREGTL